MNTVTRLRLAGRSWSEIKEMTGLSVAQAKAEVETDKKQTRRALARTSRNEDARGLNDACRGLVQFSRCDHPRKDHVDGTCLGCRERRNAQGDFSGEYECDEFVEKREPRQTDRALRDALQRQGHWNPMFPSWNFVRRQPPEADMPFTPKKRVIARLRRKKARKSSDV